MIEISKYTCVLTCRYVRVWLMHGLLTATSVIHVQEISKENNFAIPDVPAVPPPQYTDGLWGSRRMKPGSSILYLTQNYSSWKLNLISKHSGNQLQVLKHECFLVISIFLNEAVHWDSWFLNGSTHLFLETEEEFQSQEPSAARQLQLLIHHPRRLE